MSLVFLDSVGLLARLNRRDQWHQEAKLAYQELERSQSADFVTTVFVLLECGNALARSSSRSTIIRLKHDLEAAGNLIAVTDNDLHQAWLAYEHREGNSAGIVDCISFVVMRRLGIQRVFSNDEHFRAAGFETLF